MNYRRTTLLLSLAAMLTVAADAQSLQERLAMAQRLGEQTDFDRSAAILLEAVRNAEAGGERSSRLAAMLNNLGSIMQDREKYIDAERLYKASIRIWGLCFGASYAALSQPLNNLASLYLQKGDPKRAVTLRSRALAIRIRTLGPDHLEVARLRSNLAADFYAQGKYKEAERLCSDAIPKLAAASPDRAAALNTLSGAKYYRNEYGQAISLAQQAVEILELLAPVDRVLLAACLRTKALALSAEARREEAASDLRRALALLEQSPVSDTQLRVSAMHQYAALLRQTRHAAEARQLEKQAQTLYVEWLQGNLMQHSVSVEALTKAGNK